MTGTPALLLVSPGSWGGGALGSLPGGTQPRVPRDRRGPPGAALWSLPLAPLGSQPTDQAQGLWTWRPRQGRPACFLLGRMPGPG